MARCKVYKDKHSLYIRAGGHIFRPDFPVDYRHRGFKVGEIKESDKVNANHLRGTVLASVKVVGGETAETWYSHGPSTSYSPSIKMNSEDIFRPVYDQWK